MIILFLRLFLGDETFMESLFSGGCVERSPPFNSELFLLFEENGWVIFSPPLGEWLGEISILHELFDFDKFYCYYFWQIIPFQYINFGQSHYLKNNLNNYKIY